MKKKLVIGILLLLVVLAAAWGYRHWRNAAPKNTNTSGSSAQSTPATTEPAPVAQSGEVSVNMSDYKFTPDKLVIKKGTRVTWTNQDEAQHDIASDSDSQLRGLASPQLAKNQTFSNIFNEVGSYTYHCKLHPYMNASIQVVE